MILAGSDGNRLKSLTRKIAGNERPKQFCSVLGKNTLLDETRYRAAIELARQRTLFVVNHAHELYYRPILGNELASIVAYGRRASSLGPKQRATVRVA